jgi:histidine triad (HIT) family protein
MSTIFSKIVSGEIPCYKIAENESFLAFLDVSPLRMGHTLIIPKIEVDYIFDLEDDQLTQMILFSKQVARKLKNVIECKKIGVTVIGLEVPHAHIHLVPIDNVNDMNFALAKMNPSKEEMIQMKNLIDNY